MDYGQAQADVEWEDGEMERWRNRDGGERGTRCNSHGSGRVEGQRDEEMEGWRDRGMEDRGMEDRG